MESWEKSKNAVLKKYPTARAIQHEDGHYTVMVNEWDMLGEYSMFAKDVNDAWIKAQQSSRVTQNFNRTHPLRNIKRDVRLKSENKELMKFFK